MSSEVKDYRTLGSPGKIKVKGSFPKADYSKWLGHKIMAHFVSCESPSNVYVQLDGHGGTNLVLDMVEKHIDSLPPKEAPKTPEKHLILNPKNELKFLGHSHSTHLTMTNTSDECIAFKVKTTLPKQYCFRSDGIDVIEPFSQKKLQVVYNGSTQDEHDKLDHNSDKFLIQAMFLQPGDDHTILWENPDQEKVSNFYLNCTFDTNPIDDVDGNKENRPISQMQQQHKELNPGHPSLVFYPEDQGWYRARVLEKVDEIHYKMFFVDYGDEKILPLAYIQDCPTHLVDYVEGITLCSLTGFYKTTSEELKLLKEILNGKDAIVQIENLNYLNRMVLSVFDKDGLPLKHVVADLLQKEHENKKKVDEEVHGMTKEARDNNSSAKQPLCELNFNSIEKKISVNEEKKLNEDNDDDEEEFFFSPQAESFQGKSSRVNNIEKSGSEISIGLETAKSGTQDTEFSDMIMSIRNKIKEKENEISTLTQENKELVIKMEKEKEKFQKVLQDKEEIFACKLLGQKKNFEKQLQVEKNLYKMDFDEMQKTLRNNNQFLVATLQDSKLQIQKLTKENEEAIQSLRKHESQYQTEIELINQKYKIELKKLEDTWSQKYQEKIQQHYDEIKRAQLKSDHNSKNEEKLKLLEDEWKKSQYWQERLQQRLAERTYGLNELTNSLVQISSIVENQEQEITQLRDILEKTGHVSF